MNDKDANHAKGGGEPVTPICHLCAEDGQVLDLLLAAKREGRASTPLPPGCAERAQRLNSLLTLLDGYPMDATVEDDLVRRTIERATAARQQERFAEQVQMLSQPPGASGFRWREVLTAAAIVLIGMSLLVPTLHRTRQDAIQQACLANLGEAGKGIAQYASDHNGMLPHHDTHPGTVWWNVGDPAHSNSAQLYLLVRDGYVKSPQVLACPGNAYAPQPGDLTRNDLDWPDARAVSYSYQDQFTATPIRIDQHPNLAVLADKNPLFVTRVGRMTFDSHLKQTMPSRTHGGLGQNVLRLNGSAVWMVRPLTPRAGSGGEDNIWLMNGVKQYNGTEAPQDTDDSFLVP